MKIIRLITTMMMLLILTVTPVSAGSITLTWNPPTTYTDGSPLPASEIKNYRLYWGTVDIAILPNIVELGNVNSYTITNFAVGTYYFQVTAVAMNGNEGDPSNRVTKQSRDERKPSACTLQ